MRHRAGFTLIELSIVLVIIGLIVGAILAGRELVRGAELNSVVRDVNGYKSATATFKLKYNGLPGDMRNATAYWGEVSAGCTSQAGTGTQTCNGNGDGRIARFSTGIAYEMHRYWQHLNLAGFIPGTMSGTPFTAADPALGTSPGTNIPASRVSGGGYTMFDWGNNYGNASLFTGNNGNVIVFGRGGASMLDDAILNPGDASAIDGKMDDGAPAAGSVIARSFVTCVTSATPSAAAYDMPQTNPTCTLIFRNMAQ